MSVNIKSCKSSVNPKKRFKDIPRLNLSKKQYTSVKFSIVSSKSRIDLLICWFLSFEKLFLYTAHKRIFSRNSNKSSDDSILLLVKILYARIALK